MTQSLLEAVLGLPANERAELASTLWDSLESETDDQEFDAGFLAEIDRRSDEIHQGTAKLYRWEDVRAEIVARSDAAQKP